eukprot:PhF_6_TR30191/c0_g1_i7/m.44351
MSEQVTVIVAALDCGCKSSFSSVFKSVISLSVVDIIQFIQVIPERAGKVGAVLNAIRRLEPVILSDSVLTVDQLKYCFHIACKCGHDTLIQDFLSHTWSGSLLENTSWMVDYRPPGTKMTFNVMTSVIGNHHVSCLAKLLHFKPALCKVVDEDDDSTVLHFAAEKGAHECIREILRIDPTMTKAVDEDNWNALHVAGYHGHDLCIRTLLDVDPAMIKTVDNGGWNALHLAALRGRDACVRLLLGVDPAITKLVDKDGRTALHKAAQYGHDLCIRT